MSIYPDKKTQILERLDKEAFYRRELGELGKPRGDEVPALCPFHADTVPSLWVNLKTGLFKCFGCEAGGDIFHFWQKRHGGDFKEALEELARQAGVEVKAPSQVAATYDYQDAKGKMFFQVCRLEPKSFCQRRPDGQGGWIWNIKGLTPVVYHLPEVLKASRIYLVEGEKDADRLRALGLTASTNPMGAGKWRQGYNKFFKGRQVVILPDRDGPGLEHALNVARHLEPVAAWVTVLELPGLADKGDVSDWLAAGGSLEALEQLAEAAQAWTPPPEPPVAAGDIHLSDLGNARRLVAQHGRDLRYCHLAKKWYWWNGKYWIVDNCGEVERRAKLTVAGIYIEASKEEDPDRRKAVGGFALRSESRDKILSMIRLAQSEPGIPVQPEELDANPWLLNCANGTIDLTSGKLQPHCREDLISRLAPVDYEPEAEFELWEKFLYRIMDVDQRPQSADRMVEFIQRSLGYSLTGNCEEECLFILWGGGANGKSTLVNTISGVLGDYARNTPVETLLSKTKGNEIPADVARLDGPRFVTTAEVDRGRKLAESLVKQLTGRDTVSARFLYGEFFDFAPQFKLWLSTNNKPVIKGADDAIWRRIMFVEFPVQIPKAERDKKLRDRLKPEWPGILAWMVRGCLEWQREGLEPPEEVLAATAEYRAEMDDLAGFLEEYCLVGPGFSATASELYEAYTSWAQDFGVRDKDIMKQQSFGRCLAERGFKRDRGTAGRRFWRGVGLRLANV